MYNSGLAFSVSMYYLLMAMTSVSASSLSAALHTAPIRLCFCGKRLAYYFSLFYGEASMAWTPHLLHGFCSCHLHQYFILFNFSRRCLKIINRSLTLYMVIKSITHILFNIIDNYSADNWPERIEAVLQRPMMLRWTCSLLPPNLPSIAAVFLWVHINV